MDGRRGRGVKMEPSPLSIIMRDLWGAKPPGPMEYLAGPVTALFCGLRTPSKACCRPEHCGMLMREMQERDMQAGLPDIRYNFLVGGDNKVYEGRGWAVQPSLPARYAEWAPRSLYVAFMGPLTPGGIRPSQNMVFNRNLLVEEGLKIDGKMLEIVKREEWGAREPKAVEYYYRSPPLAHYVFLVATHRKKCLTTEHCKSEVRRIQECHLRLTKAPDIKFNFLIGGDGLIYEGRGFHAVPSPPIPYFHLKRESVMVAFMGEFNDEPPSNKMFAAFKDLIRTGMEQRFISQKILVFHF